jgi:hypothetical protein
MTNRDLIACVESWARELADFLDNRKLPILEVVAGFGTVATAVRLSRMIVPRGARVVAVENPSRPGNRGLATLCLAKSGDG